MTPVFQTDRTATSGNCLQASLASVLEVPIETVPHFSRDESDETFYDAVRCWLIREHGLTFMCFPDSFWSEHQPVYHLISGKTPCGTEHVVVARDGAVVHDPAGHPPERVKALLAERTYWFFIAVDPSRSKSERTGL